MIVFLCNGCGKRYEVDPSLAGKKAACKECRTQFVIPTPTNAKSNPRAGTSAGPSEPTSPPAHRPQSPVPPVRPIAQPARPVAPKPSATASAISAADLFGLEDAPTAPPPRRGAGSKARDQQASNRSPSDDLADVIPKRAGAFRSSGSGSGFVFSPRTLAIGLPAGAVAFAIAFSFAYKAMNGGVNVGGGLGQIVGAITGETEHDRLIKKLLTSLNDLADILERIESPSDVQSSRPRLTELQSRVEGYQQEFQALARPSTSEDNRLKSAYEDNFKKVIARISAQSSRLQSMPGFLAGFMPRLPSFPGLPSNLPAERGFAPPFPPGFPSPVPFPSRPASSNPPANSGDVLKLVVKGVADDGHTDYVSDQIAVIVDRLPPVPNRSTSHFGDRNGKTWTITPVADPQGFADKIKFGRIESVSGRTIVVQANSMNEADRRPDETDAVARALFDLKSRSSQRRREALQHLVEAVPTNDRRSMVARAIEASLDDKDSWNRQEALKALAVWADQESVMALIAHSQDSDPFVQAEVVTALGKCKDPRAAEAIIALFDKHQRPARDALVSIGPIAEDATLKLLRHQDMFVRMEACEVLKEIGTSKSLPLLQQFARRQGSDADAAREAIRVIKAADPSQPVTTKAEKASGPVGANPPVTPPAATPPAQPAGPETKPKSSLPKGKRLSG